MVPLISALFTDPAARDFDNIIQRLSLNGRDVAFDFYGTTIQVVELLKNNPFSGKAGRVTGTREFAIPKYSFSLIYSHHGGSLVIIAILE